MDLHVDHVVFGGIDLDALADRFERLDLPTEYGGEHADGTTHMRVLAFADGSYLECIAPTPETPPTDAGYWPDRLANGAGPTAWAIRSDDPRATAREAIGAGFAVEGPTAGGRTRLDDTRVEWETVVLGAREGPVGDGADVALPFAVRDRTPRAYRVPPAWHHDGPASGVGTVVVGVPDLDRWTERFTRLAGLPTPQRTDSDPLGATVATFPGHPFALAAPVSDDSPLADRLLTLGPGPCAYLLDVPAIADAADAYPLGERAAWPTGRVAWFAEEAGTLGVVAPER